jgi:hypothetical protein
MRKLAEDGLVRVVVRWGVTGEALEVPADPGLTIIAYTVEPASKSAEALRFLASWASETSVVTGG